MWEGIIRNLAILTLCFYFGHCGTPRADSKVISCFNEWMLQPQKLINKFAFIFFNRTFQVLNRMKYKMQTVLLSLTLQVKIYNSLSKIYLYIVNLFAEILAYPFVVGKGVIKLNITFINGFNTNYHVSVKSKNDQKCREGASNCDIFYIPKVWNSKLFHCVSTIFWTFLFFPKDTLSVIIPSGSGEHVVEGDSCVLKLTCTYEITVESETNNDLLISKIYKIPECVDKSCMCLDKDRLPKPTLSEYKFSNDQIRVNYTTDLSRLNVTNNQNVTMESVDIRWVLRNRHRKNSQIKYP